MTSLAVVVTGTWGTGKTAILDQLAGEVAVVAEPARIVLSEDPSLQGNWATFTESLLDRSIRDHAAHSGGVRVYDRGVPDCLAYARWFGLQTRRYLEAVEVCHYHEEVLVCRAWEKIYSNDELRKATLEQAREFEVLLLDTYEGLGYRLVEVPTGTVENRTQFVRDFLFDGT
ncbi:MAG TPA: AAA family ATPase [Acidimicrobiia bacterium]|nr:AAA family ATPase [Acidimicrobiia bacterium]